LKDLGHVVLDAKQAIEKTVKRTKQLRTL